MLEVTLPGGVQASTGTLSPILFGIFKDRISRTGAEGGGGSSLGTKDFCFLQMLLLYLPPQTR